MGGVALEIPLGALALVGGGQGGHAADAGVQALGDPLDRPTLARRVAAFEDHHHLELLVLHPVLQLHQLALQAKQLLEVDAAVNGVALGIAGGFGEQLVEPVVVKLHLQFFVERVGEVGGDAVVQRVGVDDLGVVHGWHPVEGSSGRIAIVGDDVTAV